MSLAKVPQQPTAAALAQQEATARLLWTGGIIAFFVIQAVLWIVAITLTSQDPSHLVLEGYDQRALDWDAWQQSQRASTALGWRAELQLGPVRDVSGTRDLTLRLVDQGGEPISGAAVAVRLFHRARAAEAETLPLRELLPGEYLTGFRPQHGGTWNFEVSATRDADRFLKVLQLQVDAPRANHAGHAGPKTPR